MAETSESSRDCSSDASPHRAADEDVQNQDTRVSLTPPPRRGGGKGPMIPPPHALWGQVREARSGTYSGDDSEPTTSSRNGSGEGDETSCPETEDQRSDQEANELEEPEETGPPTKKAKLATGAASSKVSKKKKELDPVVPRPGYPTNKDFQELARLSSKADVRVDGYLDHFYQALVPEEQRGEFPRDMIRFRVPKSTDRAHDSKKGVAIYWKMPYCGFKLKLSPFVQALLAVNSMSPPRRSPLRGGAIYLVLKRCLSNSPLTSETNHLSFRYFGPSLVNCG